MTKEEWESQLPESSIFQNPDFGKALIGHTEDGRAVYNYNYMVEELAEEMKEGGSDSPYQDAIEFIDYNTLRTIPYMPNPPVIVFPFEPF